MKRKIVKIIAFIVVVTLASADATITDVSIVPSLPTPLDVISIDTSGVEGTGAVFVTDTDFRQNGTLLELDIFLDVGVYAVVTPWSHTEDIGTLNAGAYSLTVRAFDNYSGTLQDTYTVDFTVVPEPVVDAEIDIDPDTLNLASKGKWISCKIWLPEDYNVADIEPNSVVIENEPNDIHADWLWFNEKQNVAMAKFKRSDVQDILEPGEVELTVSGELADGTSFQGTDIIKVIDKGHKGR